MLDVLKNVLASADVPYAELRFHERVWNRIRVTKGELEEATSTKLSGTGIRVMYDGAWGFSSTNNSEIPSLNKALAEAVSMARVASREKRNKIEGLAEGRPAVGLFAPEIMDPIEDHSLEEKMDLVRTVEAAMRKQPMIKSAMSFYREIIDHKFIVTSHGAEAEVLDSKPEFGAMAIASENGQLMNSYEAVGITGGWSDLFRTMTAEERGLKAADMAARLLKAKHPKGEKVVAVLDPSVVGLIAHEAFGHTVEADFVLSGSIAQGKLGQKVASDLVTLVDEGYPKGHEHAGGAMMIDDEGCLAGRAAIIEKGILKTYLHNKESAHIFGVDCTGNARAFEYSDDPIIRMRNTYIESGEWKLEEMIKEIKHGYLLKHAGGGQADANAEFMFQVQEPYRIENGEVKELVRGVTMSGQAFDVLSSVDAIGKDFELDLGSGYCGKFQPAKVDGGGAPLRCKVLVGGVQ